ncbi:MAG: dUTP diphosphatase [Bacilli bacterium]
MNIEEKNKLIEEIKDEIFKSQKVYVEKISDDVKLPFYAKIGDAGMDIRSTIDIIIYPKETIVLPTGLKMAIPKGFEIQVRPRSGLSLKTPLRIVNSPGTIDSGYKDEIGIIINNSSCTIFENKKDCPIYTIDEKGNKFGAYSIKKGDRIAQLVLSRFETIEFELTDNVELMGINRGGGFGSSGIK